MMFVRHISMHHEMHFIITMCKDVDRLMDAFGDVRKQSAAETVDLFAFGHLLATVGESKHTRREVVNF